ncbi:MAG TPA: DUF1659 domain-containing protein [Bacillales bacterium]|nr:DUF1659 domain-containing protein [Bacillales bacterium]
MAQVMLAETSLKLIFDAGMNEKGEPVYKTKTFNNVKKEATTDQLFQTAQALAVLCIDPLDTVLRNDNSEIIA